MTTKTMSDAEIANALALRDYLYPRDSGAMRSNRLAALRVAFPECRQADRLPRNLGTATWTDGLAYYRLLPFNPDPSENSRHQGRARFLVQCPACGRWASVGKFMLHARVHDAP